MAQEDTPLIGDADNKKATTERKWRIVLIASAVFFFLAAVGLAAALAVVKIREPQCEDTVLSPAAASDPLDEFPLQAAAISDLNSFEYPRELQFTVSEGTWINLDVSPDGTELVFDLLGDLYTLPISGGLATVLRSGVSYDTQPRYSADGKFILFRSDETGIDNVYVLERANASNVRAITNEQFRFVSNAVWGSDDSYIVAVNWHTTTRSIPAGEIWSYPIQGAPTSGQRIVGRKSFDTQMGPEEPTVDANGLIYYSQNTADPSGVFSYSKNPHAGIYTIYSVDTKGNQAYVTGGPGGAARPIISPDGKTLAFVRTVLKNESIVLYDVTTQNERILWDGLSKDQQAASAPSGVYPYFAFLPDSSAIVVWAQGALWKVDVATGNATNIPFTANVDLRLAETVRPSIDISDRHGVFNTKVITSLDAASEVVVFTSVGQTFVNKSGTITPLPNKLGQTALASYPALHPSDNDLVLRLVYTDATLHQLSLIRISTQEEQEVPQLLRGRYIKPRFSADGKYVLIVRLGSDTVGGIDDSQNAGLYVINLQDGTSTYVLNEIVYNAGWFSANSGWAFDGDSLLYWSLDSSVAVSQVAPATYASEIVISPNGDYLAFTEFENVYIKSWDQSTKSAEEISARSALGAGSLRISDFAGGQILAFSQDSKFLHYLVGADLYTLPIDTAFSKCATKSDVVAYCANQITGPVSLSVVVTPTNAASKLDYYVIDNVVAVTMSDRTGGIIPNARIIIAGDTIAAVGPMDSVPLPSNVKGTFNGQGNIVIPGLIDAHAHWSGADGFQVQQSWEFLLNLAYGVTTLQNPSIDTVACFADAELIQAGLLLGPRLFATGTIIYGAGGKEHRDVPDLDTAVQILRSRKAYGATSVKSYQQPNRVSRKLLLQAAEQLNMAVVPEGGMNHFWDMTYLIDGHTTHEHAMTIATVYNDIKTLFSYSGTAYTPTHIVNYGGIYGERFFWDRTNVWEQEPLATFYPQRRLWATTVRRYHAEDWDYLHFETATSGHELFKNGTEVLMGAHGQMQGIGAHWEMNMFVQGGFSPIEAIWAATHGPANALGLSDVGQIKVSGLADLLIYPVGVDPTQNISESVNILNVIKGGVVFDPKTMNQASTRRHHFDQRERNQTRQQEFVREDLIKKLTNESLIRESLISDTRVDNKRRMREDQTIQNERKTQSSLLEAERLQRERLEQAAHDAAVAAQVEKESMEKLRGEKLRQALRENSEELRELERSLKKAYMNKERAMQLQERALLQQQEKLRETKLAEQLNEQLRIANEQEKQKEEQQHVLAAVYHEDLKKQLQENERRKNEEYQHFLQEKAMIDAIVAKIMHEDEMENMRRLEKQKEAKQYIDDFMRDRQIWVQKELDLMEEETKKIKEYAELQKQREAALQKKKTVLESEKEAVYNKLARDISEEERRKSELMELRVELGREEQEEKDRQLEKAQMEMRIRKRLELIEIYRQQIQQKRARLLQEKEEEESFRQKMMEKFAADEKIEQMNAQKRRLRQLEHKRAVDKMLEDRRIAAAAERETEAEMRRRELELERMRQEVIEQERQRILRQHASKLAGFVPKGVLRDQRDLDLFDEEFRKKFEPKPKYPPLEDD